MPSKPHPLFIELTISRYDLAQVITAVEHDAERNLKNPLIWMELHMLKASLLRKMEAAK